MTRAMVLVWLGLSPVIFWGCRPSSEGASGAMPAAPCLSVALGADGSGLLWATPSEQVPARAWPGASPARRAGVVFVTGIDGGFVEPADGIYSRLAQELAREGVSSVFVTYRYPGDQNLDAGVEDASAGVRFLLDRGFTRLALVGWSFGGAVIVNTAVGTPEVRSLVAFAPQSRFTEPVSRLQGRSFLVFHSPEDENVPFEAAGEILEAAPADSKKRLYPVGANHSLDGAGNEIEPVALDWLRTELLDGAESCARMGQ